MKRLLLVSGIVLAAFAVYAIAHMLLIEVGREVVVLHKWTSEGATRPTRLWIVDDGEQAWLHHGYADSGWIRRLEHDPVVSMERGGATRRYRATTVWSADRRVHELMRRKYGVADWWVRIVTGGTEHCKAAPVRLEALEAGGP